jgi:thymidylate synthase (FAD)
MTQLRPGSPIQVQATPPAAVPPGPSFGSVVTRTRPEAPMADLMEGDARREVRVLDHGFVALVDVMPRMAPQGQTADQAIVQAARVSYGAGTKKVNEDRGLIRYLLRHKHTTPFEMVEFKFHIAMPIFIARQWIRHRTANVNEYSGRYSLMPDRFYRPTIDQVRKQSATNRQGGAERFDVSGLNEIAPPAPDPTPASGAGDPTAHHAAWAIQPDRAGAAPDPRANEALTAKAFVEYLEESERLYQKYLDLTKQGVSREMARIGLPVSLYTEWYWKIDLHNLLHFLNLRLHSHAQEEIRIYARAMHDLIQPLAPVTMEAWRDYNFEEGGGIRLSRLEVEALRDRLAGGAGNLPSDNKREQAEWEGKKKALGL